MSVQRKVKLGSVFALAAAALLMVLLAVPEILDAWAAGGNYSLTISVPVNESGGNGSEYLDELNNMTIPVSVYKVADLNDAGSKLTPIDIFAGLNFDKINQGTEVADDMRILAEQAAKIVREAKNPTPAGVTKIVKAKDETNAKGVVTGLTAGMYLIVPDSVKAAEDKPYIFTPSLVALGVSSDGTSKPDDNVSVDLKPGTIVTPPPNEEYGSLKITKNLQDFNESLGRTTFVFRVVGVDVHGTTKYEEVVSLDFDAPGDKTVTLSNIPTGLKVTVTEIYSGASYEIVGPKEATVTIISDESVRLGNGQMASVSFKNRYNGKDRYGYGVENRFKSDGKNGWIWESSAKSANK